MKLISDPERYPWRRASATGFRGNLMSQAGKNGLVGVVGHRGWPARYPDNTLAGIIAAFEFADMVETDVRRTVDGRLVLSHDPRLGGLLVCQTPWSELERLDIGGGHHPVLLEELLRTVPEPLNLEVKNDPAEPGFEGDQSIARQVAALARDQDLVTSFYWPSADAAKEHRPALETGLLVDARWSVIGAIDHALDHQHGVLAVHWSLLARDPEAVVDKAAEAGLRIVAWTVNDLDLADRLARAGVAAIITDDPSRFGHLRKPR